LIEAIREIQEFDVIGNQLLNCYRYALEDRVDVDDLVHRILGDLQIPAHQGI